MAAYAAAASLRKTLSQLLSIQQIRALDIVLYNLLRFLNDNREFEIRSQDVIYEAEDVIDSHMPSALFVSPSEAEISIQHIRALDRGLYSLQRFLDDNRNVDREFEIRIRDAIYEAEDIIDSHMPSAIFISPSEAEIRNPSFCSELEGLIQSINSIVEMTKSEEFDHRKISNSAWKGPREIKRAYWSLVGRCEDAVQLNNQLLGGSEELGLVSIVGIAGVGKSFLAEALFQFMRIEEYFNVCGWCKVPIEYKKRDVLLALLLSMNHLSDEIH